MFSFFCSLFCQNNSADVCIFIMQSLRVLCACLAVALATPVFFPVPEQSCDLTTAAFIQKYALQGLRPDC